MYKHWTLGALSVKKGEADIKRHSTIEDDVTIYSNAAILGGDWPRLYDWRQRLDCLFGAPAYDGGEIETHGLALRFLVGDYKVDIVDIRFIAELGEIIIMDKPF
ncbi:hypothetical protein ACYULU_16370 [Breznakiellaceae bacterium SP9]